jgi:glutamine synthetase
MTETAEAGQATLEARVAALTDAGVRFVRVLYADLHGIPRGKEIPIGELAEAVENGVYFVEAIMTVDLRHNVVAGFEHGFQDIVARADLGTLVQTPWEPRVAWCLADLERVTGEPYGADPRGALRRAMVSWAELECTPVIAPELEFYLCREDASARCGFRPYEENDSHVYTAGCVADPQGLLSELFAASLDFGIGPCAANHEYGRSQFEINIKHGEGLDSADRAFRFKALVKELAARAGLMATFMGKPWNDDEGSGFHLHLSIVDEAGENVLAAPDDQEGELSPLALRYIAGVLAHAPALMAFFNPTVNSYRRIHPEALVPTRVNWGHDNRFTLVRVPPERGAHTRVEVRIGDGAANPYLAYAAALNAGLDGVQKGLEPPAPVAGNVYELPEEAQGALLPVSFPEALDALEADETIRAAMGEELVSTFLEIKRYEVDRYRRYVTDWDFAEYAHHL